MLLYKTVAKRAQAEQVIDRSRFISYVCPVESREEAELFIEDIKSLQKQATHNVPAFIIGRNQELKWASDAGEPQGTSGPPMLAYLEKEELTNLVVVVTRYFGGIKLGTGGLVRAYSSSAKLAVEAAGIAEAREMMTLSVGTDYSILPKLQNMAMQQGSDFSIGEISYTDQVTLNLSCDVENADRVRQTLANISNGTARILMEEKGIITVEI